MNEERRKIQSIDQKFRTRHKAIFQNTSIRRTGRKIRVNGDIISDPATVLCAWKEHFEGLGQSGKDDDCVVSAADQRTNALLSQSYNNDEHILDIPFQSEEIEHALNKLKLKKSPEHGGITAEHLKYGGQDHHLKLWLLQILNAIIDLEFIPDVLNLAILTPVYKGSGKDPKKRGSYRGISVTPVISKLLEILILMRLEPYLQELGIPHINQTGYRRHTSCADAIFSTAELMDHYLEKTSTYVAMTSRKPLTQLNMVFCCVVSIMEITASLVFGPKMPSATEWYTIQSIFTPKRCPARLGPSPILFFACDGPTAKRNGELASWTIFCRTLLGRFSTCR